MRSEGMAKNDAGGKGDTHQGREETMVLEKQGQCVGRRDADHGGGASCHGFNQQGPHNKEQEPISRRHEVK